MAANLTPTTAVGVFRDYEQARNAVEDLRHKGFDEERIGVASRYEETETQATPQSAESHAGTGAATGGAAGLGVGALWGIAVVTGLLPAIGPAIAGGTLAAILSSAVAGGALAGIAGALVGLGIPKEEAEYYGNEFKEGRTIVTVDAGDRFNEAVEILESHGAYQAAHAGAVGR
ncbi:MAG: general stress protein [Patescibacteria group bacterium]|nr:general stress protein [Patescibacteria group bacterium]